MSVTYGFYNSKNGDRRYNALQMGMMFDGFIKNGIVMNAENYPGHLMVKESDPYSMTVKVLPGKAWWLFTWTLNDSPLDLTLDPADTVNSRIDAVVLDIDQRDDARTNSFKIVKGNPEAEAKKPSLASEAPHIQIPLAYITVSANATSVRQADIENCIGTDACPYVTGFLKSQSTEELFAQWQDQFKKSVGRTGGMGNRCKRQIYNLGEYNQK